ncbi:uncharacterized protein AAGF69_010738 isoform 1-T2 [Amazona ochrocephala]
MLALCLGCVVPPCRQSPEISQAFPAVPPLTHLLQVQGPGGSTYLLHCILQFLVVTQCYDNDTQRCWNGLSSQMVRLLSLRNAFWTMLAWVDLLQPRGGKPHQACLFLKYGRGIFFLDAARVLVHVAGSGLNYLCIPPQAQDRMACKLLSFALRAVFDSLHKKASLLPA